MLSLAKSLIQKSSSNRWVVSEGSDQWQTLLLVVAGLEFGQSVFFAGDIFSKTEIEDAAARLPTSGVPSFAFLTSGSTGIPKTVIHSTEALVVASNQLAGSLDLGGRRMPALFPPNYMAGVLNCVVLPWVTAGSIVIDSPFSFQTPLEMPFQLDGSRSEVAWLSPRMIRSLATAARSRGELRDSLQRHWSLVASATGPIDTGTRDAFTDLLQIPVLNTFGTTEHLFISAETEVSSTLSCGFPLPGTDILFDAEPGGASKKSSSGRSSGVVWARTPYMAASVTSVSPNLDKSTFKFAQEAGFRSTGDVGSLRQGRLYIDCRADDLIVWDGINVSPKTYENLANGIPSVIDSMLSVVSHGGRELLVLFAVVSGPDSTPSVIKAIRQRFRTWDVNMPKPQRVVAVQDLPRTHTGKVNRRGGQRLFEIAEAE